MGGACSTHRTFQVINVVRYHECDGWVVELFAFIWDKNTIQCLFVNYFKRKFRLDYFFNKIITDSMATSINKFNNFCIVTQGFYHRWKSTLLGVLIAPLDTEYKMSCANEFFRHTMRSDLLLSLANNWPDKRMVQKVSNNSRTQSATLSIPRSFSSGGARHCTGMVFYFLVENFRSVDYCF